MEFLGLLGNIVDGTAVLGCMLVYASPCVALYCGQEEATEQNRDSNRRYLWD